MKIGYACLTIGVVDTQLKSVTAKNATGEQLHKIIKHNLNVLARMIDYNRQNGIQLFRISSDIIPFGSSPINQLCWWEDFASELSVLSDKINKGNIRVSMHPGQYTVLNSIDDTVVQRAVQDLRYHSRFLDAIGAQQTCKIILHVGGAYGDKLSAMQRFKQNYLNLDEAVRKRLVIENDDRIFTAQDVLQLSTELGVPMVFDTLHNTVNPSKRSWSEQQWIEESGKTWGTSDGDQKIHYAQQDPMKKPGSHSKTINLHAFLQFYKTLASNNLDIMLEVKDKNLSALKCVNSTIANPKIKNLELEWRRYKYKILEKSPVGYQEIRNLLKDKNTYPVNEFYSIVEHALSTESEIGTIINAIQHIWGYFKDKASEQEKKAFFQMLEKVMIGEISQEAIKRSLYKLALKYQQTYLLESLYFFI